MKWSENLILFRLNFEFEYRVWAKIENKNKFTEAETLDELRMTPCPRDADLKNGSRQKGERALL
jgi:hypothetical protein